MYEYCVVCTEYVSCYIHYLCVRLCVWNSNVQKIIIFNVLLGGNLLVGRPVLSSLSRIFHSHATQYSQYSVYLCVCTAYEYEYNKDTALSERK